MPMIPRRDGDTTHSRGRDRSRLSANRRRDSLCILAAAALRVGGRMRSVDVESHSWSSFSALRRRHHRGQLHHRCAARVVSVREPEKLTRDVCPIRHRAPGNHANHVDTGRGLSTTHGATPRECWRPAVVTSSNRIARIGPRVELRSGTRSDASAAYLAQPPADAHWRAWPWLRMTRSIIKPSF